MSPLTRSSRLGRLKAVAGTEGFAPSGDDARFLLEEITRTQADLIAVIAGRGADALATVVEAFAGTLTVDAVPDELIDEHGRTCSRRPRSDDENGVGWAVPTERGGMIASAGALRRTVTSLLNAAAALRRAGVLAPATVADADAETMRGDVHHIVNPVVGHLRWHADRGDAVTADTLLHWAAALTETTDRVDAFVGEPPLGRQLDAVTGGTSDSADDMRAQADLLAGEAATTVQPD